MRIGFLGTGKMGAGMAACLADAGHDVTAWNRTPDRAEALRADGVTPASSPAEAARDAEAIFSMVADDAASTRCWLGPDGALAAAGPGTLAIECSTISLDQCRRLETAARDAGLAYLDCPVNGPPVAARAGELILLCGAEAEILDRARPLLDTISKSLLHFGPPGTGTAYKLINNLLGAVHISAMAEAAALAAKLGMDTDTMVAAIESGPVASPHTVRMARPMLEDRPADRFGLSIGLREKDSRYCLEMAQSLHVAMPVGERAHAWYAAAARHDAAEDDSLLLATVAGHHKDG